jgi:flagellar secretion chaperone FliS
MAVNWVNKVLIFSGVRRAVNPQAALKSYAKVQYRSNIEVASPHRLIDMLFEGAIERIIQAKGAMEYGDIELKGRKINGAVSIVGGLRESLSTENGGELAMNLDNLYLYIQGVLTAAHLKNDPLKLDEAVTLLTDLRSAWQQIG